MLTPPGKVQSEYHVLVSGDFYSKHEKRAVAKIELTLYSPWLN